MRTCPAAPFFNSPCRRGQTVHEYSSAGWSAIVRSELPQPALSQAMAGMAITGRPVSAIVRTALTGTFREHTCEAPSPKLRPSEVCPCQSLRLPYRVLSDPFFRPGVEGLQWVAPDLFSLRAHARVCAPPRALTLRADASVAPPQRVLRAARASAER
jgi:hypothetical protein